MKNFIVLFIFFYASPLFSQKIKFGNSAEDIIDRYLEVTGGREKWKNISTLEIKGYSAITLDLNESNVEKILFKNYYRNKPACLSIIMKNTRSVKSTEFFKIYEYKTREWSDLSAFSRKSDDGGVGLTLLSFTMYFANLDSETKLIKSDKFFGDDYEVIEMVKPITSSGKVRIVYYLFSKETGRLKTVKIEDNGDFFSETELNNYEIINGFSFATSLSFNYNSNLNTSLTKEPSALSFKFTPVFFYILHF
jgi:hypothetical protein